MQDRWNGALRVRVVGLLVLAAIVGGVTGAGCGRREPRRGSTGPTPESVEDRLAREKRAKARALQERAASTDRMVRVPAGRYRVGDGSLQDCPESALETQGFYIDLYEVTNAEYFAFTEAESHPVPRSWVQQRPDGTYEEKVPDGLEDYPVTTVSYHDAAAYADWAGKRLPTAAEWEVAARGQDRLHYPWGSTYIEGYANDDKAGRGSPCPVEAYPEGKSPFGCFNMAGNVQEWTATAFDRPEARDERIVKGGSYRDSYFTIQPAMWKPVRAAVDRVEDIGFRCAKDVE